MSALMRHPIPRLLAQKHLRVLGINSGTSIDSLDGALIEISTDRARPVYRVRRAFTRRFPPAFRRELLALATEQKIAKQTASVAHLALGRLIGQTARRWMDDAPADLVAAHGQTIAHYPAGPIPSTWQIGAVNAIALECGRVTIGDFRLADVAAGGMGAPLSGYYHHLLFGPDVPVLNLGGIANISLSRVIRGQLRVTALDTGPGNMILDSLAQHRLKLPFDRAGRVASRGTVQTRLLARLITLPYFRQRPPKSCGREEFGWEAMRKHFASAHLDTADALATAADLTAWTIADAARRWIAPLTARRTLVVSGGGAQNWHLMTRLREYLGDWTLASADEFGAPSRYLEPVGFAALAYETLWGRAGNLGGATRAYGPAVLGTIALPPPRA